MQSQTQTPNTPFIECWNEILTPKWVRFRHLLSGNGQIHSEEAYPTLPLRPGDRVLDIGCGFGETTLDLAERVGPEGWVVGLDCTQEFLEIAGREQHTAEISNASYLLGDVETLELEPDSFDAAVSRFGIMFCASPVRALRNVRRALRPGGVLGLICWRTIADNPCWGVAEQIALKHLPPPGDDAATCGPGPFAMAGEETNGRILEASGFESVRHRRIDRPVCVGRNLEEAIDYQMLVGPAGFVVREAGEQGEQKREAIREEMRHVFAGHQRDDGSVWLDSSTWFITARAPAA